MFCLLRVVKQELSIFVVKGSKLTAEEAPTLSLWCIKVLENLVEGTDLIPLETDCTPSVQEVSLQVKKVYYREDCL